MTFTPHQPSSTSPGREGKDKKKQKDQVTNYYPPNPIYVATYKKENTSTSVNNLIPGPKESDWDSDYSYSC